MDWIRFGLWLGVVLLLSPRRGADAADVQLAWDANDTRVPLEYRLHYRQTSPAYGGAWVSAGSNLMVTVSNVLPGVTYFQATAVAASGTNVLESVPSNEIAYTNRNFGPTNLTITLGGSGGSAKLHLERSLDLQGEWSDVASITATNTGAEGFYRGRLEIQR